MSIKSILKEALLPNSNDSDCFKAPKKKEEHLKKVAPIVYNVTSYYEIENIASNLFLKQSIIVNLSSLALKDKYRVVDFLSGVIYSLNGTRTKLEDNIYLFAISD